MSVLNSNFLKGLVSSCILAISAQFALSAPKVTASLDSAYILMGKQTVMHVVTDLQNDLSEVRLVIPNDTLTDKIEIVSVSCDTADISGGIRQLRHNIIIQSFDSGLYAIPPVPVVIGNDTSFSNHLILKVIPVNVDSLQGQIHDFEGVVAPERHFWDFLPDSVINWIGWLLLIIFILAAGAAVYFYILRRRQPTAETIRIIPPYEEAIEALRKLHSEHLCENGHEREFYTRLTDILRVYLFRRFGIAAMEMTTSQILHALSENSETKWSRKQIQDVLSMADFVKFAKLRPLPDDNVSTFRAVENFVESTRPLPENELTDKVESSNS